MENNLKLGLLDFGRRKTKYSSMGKILDVVEYAKEADATGFSRFWLAEHHNYSSSDAWSSPQMLLPLFLSETENINIGMAGVLLNYYSSYEIAMNFKMLANLFPHRVNLGFAAGTPPLNVSQLLAQNNFENRPSTIPVKIEQLFEFFYREDLVAEKQKITIPPFKGLVPEMFMLSNSFNKIDTAVKLRLNISKSIFHREDSLIYQKDDIKRYKEAFYEEHECLPLISVAFTGVCAASETVAKQLAKTSGYKNFYNAIIGTPGMFEEKLRSHQENFGIDEFIFHDATTVNELRIESLHALNEVFKLNQKEISKHEI